MIPRRSRRSRIARVYCFTTSSAPDRVLYRSPKPILSPETPRERVGVVDNVVFPTGIDPRPDLADGTYDVYYGMGDHSIGAARLRLE